MLTEHDRAILSGLEVKEKRHNKIIDKLKNVTDGKLSWVEFTQWYAKSSTL